jgi:hypothetical protein
MTTIMLSYRREDSRWIAGRIFDRLEIHYGKGNVYMDIDNIPVGFDFRENIQNSLESCDILLAIVGPHWLGTDEQGRHAIEDESDWVRIEIEAALAKKIPVIPVLIDRTRLPKSTALPESIRNFAFRQAAEVDSGIDFRPHMDRLIRSMDHYLQRRSAVPSTVPSAIPSTVPSAIPSTVPFVPAHAPSLRLPNEQDQNAMIASFGKNDVAVPKANLLEITSNAIKASRRFATSWAGIGCFLFASALTTFLSELGTEDPNRLLVIVSVPLGGIGLVSIGSRLLQYLKVHSDRVALKRAIAVAGTLLVAIVPIAFNWTHRPSQFPTTLACPLVLLGGLGMVFIGTVLVSHLVQAEGRNRHLKMWTAVTVVALTFTWLECSLSLDYLPTIDWRIHSTLVFTCVIAAFTVIFVFASWFLLQFLGYRPVRLTKDANNKID